jgi:hypothetical protein
MSPTMIAVETHGAISALAPAQELVVAEKTGP